MGIYFHPELCTLLLTNTSSMIASFLLYIKIVTVIFKILLLIAT